MNAVGIDVSKGKSTVAVLRPYGEVVVSPFDVAHTGSDLRALADLIKKLPGETKVVMEATGNYFESIVHNPKFIIADEPTGALDSETSKEIMALFNELNQKLKITIIMVTHDKNITHNCNRKYFMLDGVLKERDSYEV